jgi:putative component of membrane protein insertase Oxa1/YidC/SpoIIIJ protein YidD
MGIFVRNILLVFLPLSLFADPWGKDAQLCQAPKEPIQRCQTAVFGPFAEMMIKFHQTVISPADGPRSHFYPSSSQYTLDAMRKYGFFKGFLLGCDRLMRENPDPWVYTYIQLDNEVHLKHDPVR